MKSYKHYLLGFAFSAALAAMIAATPAGAQTANSGSVSGSNSTSSSGSASGARAQSGGGNQSITFNSSTPADTRTTSTQNANINNTGGTNNRDAVSYSGGTTNYSRNDGDVTVRTTPTVYAPPVSGGNPCTLAVSGGVSVIGWGAAAGGTFVDEACATRQKIAMIHNAGYAAAAKELMCDDKATYFAFRTAGTPCAYRAVYEGNVPAPQPAPVPPMVQQQPGPVVVTPAVQPRAATVAPKQYVRCAPPRIVDNCVSG